MMNRTLTTLALLCCVSCTAVNKAEELIGKVSAQVDNLKPKVEAAAALANTAVETAKAAKAQAEAKADDAMNTLAAKGAPVDGSAGDFMAWVAKNPLDAAKDPTLVATTLAAIMLGYKRKKERAALAAVVKGIEDSDDDVKEKVKASIKENGGDASRSVIRAVKKEVV